MLRTNVVGTTPPPGSGAQRCAQAGERENSIDSTADTAATTVARSAPLLSAYEGPLLARHLRDSMQLTLLRPDGSGKTEATPNKLTIGTCSGLPMVLAPARPCDPRNRNPQHVARRPDR